MCMYIYIYYIYVELCTVDTQILLLYDYVQYDYYSTSSGQPRMICLNLESPVTLEGFPKFDCQNQDHPLLSIETRIRTSLNRGVG